MAIAPFSQVPTQPSFTPQSGARPAGPVTARLGHQRGGGRREPESCTSRGPVPATQACPARLLASSSPSHPPSVGLRWLTSEMGQYVCPSDTSIKWTLHLQMMEFCLTFLCFIFTTTLRLYRCFFPPVLKLSSVLLKRADRFLASRFLLQIPLLSWSTNMQPESCQRPMTCPQQTSLIDHNLPFGDSRLGLGILLYTSVQAAIWIQPELAPTAKTTATVPISDSSNSEGGCKEKRKSRAESALEEHNDVSLREILLLFPKPVYIQYPPRSPFLGRGLERRLPLSLLHLTEKGTEAQASESRSTELRVRGGTGSL